MIQNKPFAGFLLRLLAASTQTSVLYLLHTLFWFLVISKSQNLAEFMYYLSLYFIFCCLPWYPTITLLMSYLTSKFGGNLGKLLTGLKVVSKNGSYLPFKKALFRATIGYTFSTLLFGLGYLNIITDFQKRAWHDKTIGSYVVKKNNIWILSIIILLITFFINTFLIFSSISHMINGPLKTEVISIFDQINKTNEKIKEPNRVINGKFIESLPGKKT